MFIGHTTAFWGVIAAVVYDVITLSLLFVGYRNLRALRHQLVAERLERISDLRRAEEQAARIEDHHADQIEAMSDQVQEQEKSREALLRPHVVQSDVMYDDSKGVDFEFTNIGPGPALDIEGDCWWTFSSMHEPDRQEAASAVREHTGASGIALRVGALGSGAARRINAFGIEGGPELPHRACIALHTVWTWRDVFGNQYEGRSTVTAWSSARWLESLPPFQVHPDV